MSLSASDIVRNLEEKLQARKEWFGKHEMSVCVAHSSAQVRATAASIQAKRHRRKIVIGTYG